MFASKSNGAIGASLLLVIFLWGGNNTAVKFLVAHWPLMWIGASRMLCVGVLMLAVLRWTNWLGANTTLSPAQSRAFWWRGGLSLAVYTVIFISALKYTSASHVALYLGTSPVWALLWEGRPRLTWDSTRRYGAALVALAGVAVLFWPKLKAGGGDWRGDILAVVGSVVWTIYSRQCRVLGEGLSGAAITAHTMWRAGLILLPPALLELARGPLEMHVDLILIQGYCVIFGGVIAFALWNNALKLWPTSKVFLFGNLIPGTTMAWAWLCLREPITPTFWLAMALIVAGVVLGQTNWQKIFGTRWSPE